jgi:hypothetical protein
MLGQLLGTRPLGTACLVIIGLPWKDGRNAGTIDIIGKVALLA